MKTVAETDDAAFADTATHCLTVEILAEDYERGKALLEDSELAADEGWRYILANGIAYLEGKQMLVKLNRPDVTSDMAAQVDDLVGKLLRLNGQYAVMKFKAFRFMQNARVWEMNAAGLRGALAFSETTIPRLRDQVKALREENAALKARLAQQETGDGVAAATPVPVTTSAEASAEANPQASIWQRLLGRG